MSNDTARDVVLTEGPKHVESRALTDDELNGAAGGVPNPFVDEVLFAFYSATMEFRLGCRYHHC
jgi:hypothetical protein